MTDFTTLESGVSVSCVPHFYWSLLKWWQNLQPCDTVITLDCVTVFLKQLTEGKPFTLVSWEGVHKYWWNIEWPIFLVQSHFHHQYVKRIWIWSKLDTHWSVFRQRMTFSTSMGWILHNYVFLSIQRAWLLSFILLPQCPCKCTENIY